METTRVFGSTLIFLAGCTVGVVGEPPRPHDPLPEQPTTPQLDSIAGGSFHAIAPFADIAGRALMARKLDGQTYLSISITGLTASLMYTAHLHAAPCQYQGGGHYKIDPAVTTALESNELWLRGASSGTGTLFSDRSFAHLTRGEALSIVVHDPATGAKMACADLLADDPATVEFTSVVTPFSAATAEDISVTGTVGAIRAGTATTITLNLDGLTETALGYGAHVHALPCGVMAAGGHYKLDPIVADTLETNEIWLPVTDYEDRNSTATVNVSHAIRTDAQSVVIHRLQPDATAPKIACANLARATPRTALDTTGTAKVLAAAAGLAVRGSAIMTRKLTGVTEVAIVVTGLAPSTTYMAHVHDQACGAGAGGGHFKFDRTIADARSDNEIWLELVSDDEGAAYDATWVAKLAGADAASLVIHDGAGGRVACFDLE